MKTIVYIRSTSIFDDSRATKEIITLANNGYKMVVLSWDRYGDAKEKNKVAFHGLDVEFKYYSKCIPNGIGFKNIIKLLGWIRWIKKTIKKINDIYAIHSCNLDTGIALIGFLQRNKKIKFVYDIFDYYVDSHSIPRVLKHYIEQREIDLINFADTTIICTDERKQQIIKSNPKKLVVIHNSPEISSIPVKPTSYDYVYCGSLQTNRLIKEILDEYPSHKHLRFYFVGYGFFADYCRALAEKYENFIYSGPVPYSEVLSIESQSSVISAIYDPEIRNHRLCAPNKFYEALALKKPVIVCKGTGIDKIVCDYDIGEVVDYSAKQFYDALEKIIKDKKLAAEMGERGRNLYEIKYRWGIMEKILLSVYKETK